MILAGVVARRSGIIEAATNRRLALLVVRFLYPALILHSMLSTFTFPELVQRWHLPVGMVGIMGIGFLVGAVLIRVLPLPDSRLRRAFHFQCTVSNYIFLPMPLALLLWGEKGVGALIFSTLGSEVAVWTLGVLALTGGGLGRDSLKRLCSVPMAALLGAWLVLGISHVTGVTVPPSGAWHETVDAFLSVLKLFGAGTIPLAMIVAGSRMAELRLSHLWSWPQAVVIALRLVLIPALCVGLLVLLPIPAESRKILVLIAVMPASIASVILAEIYDADGRFGATAVLLTTLLSLLTIPLWLRLAVL